MLTIFHRIILFASVNVTWLWLGFIQASDMTLPSANVLPPQVLADSLQARHVVLGELDSEKRTALFKELALREALVNQQSLLSREQAQQVEKQVNDTRKTLVAQQVLDALAAKDMPDFSARAEELYQARKVTQYTTPLRLRVRVLQQKIQGDVGSVLSTLNTLRQQVLTGSLDFKQAVKQYSDAANKSLTEGDSFWFDASQKSANFFQAAAQLTKTQPLSEAFVSGDSAYLLYFLERQEATIQPYAAVKDQIIAELKEAYLKQQRQQVLDTLTRQIELGLKDVR